MRPLTAAMQDFVFLLGSAVPILLFGSGAFLFRGARAPQRLVLLLILLLASAPLGALIIEVAFPFHGRNPGQGVKYVLLVEAWVLTIGCWLIWAALNAIVAYRRAR